MFTLAGIVVAVFIGIVLGIVIGVIMLLAVHGVRHRSVSHHTHLLCPCVHLQLVVPFIHIDIIKFVIWRHRM